MKKWSYTKAKRWLTRHKDWAWPIAGFLLLILHIYLTPPQEKNVEAVKDAEIYVDDLAR